MKANIKPAERWIRVALGLAILSLVFFGPQTAWGYLGLIALVSAASGFCPLYKVLGVGSCDACEGSPRKV